MELISVGIRRSNFGFSRVKKIKHSRATVHFFEEESIQKNKSKPGIYYFHVPKQRFSLSSILNAGLIGLAGTVLVGIGADLLQDVPSGNYGHELGLGYEFFYEIPE